MVTSKNNTSANGYLGCTSAGGRFDSTGESPSCGTVSGLLTCNSDSYRRNDTSRQY